MGVRAIAATMAASVSTAATATMATSGAAARIFVANSGRIDYDSSIDWNVLGGSAAGAVVAERSDPSSDEEFMRRMGQRPGVEVVVTKEIPVSAAVVDSFPASVRLLCEAGTGFNNVDLEACRRRGVAVMNVPAYSSDSVATLVMTFILNLSSSLHLQMRRLACGDRVNFTDCLQSPHFELRGKVLGLVGGSGSIGSRVSELAQAFGMRVLISTRAATQRNEELTQAASAAGSPPPQVEFTDSVERLLRESDFVSLHCPLTDATRHLIDAAALRTMKPSAFLVNTARGAIVDEAALTEALASGVIAGAGLDVQEQEPPPEQSPLYGLENVILTPHIGWKRKETREALVGKVAANIKAFFESKPGEAPNVVS